MKKGLDKGTHYMLQYTIQMKAMLLKKLNEYRLEAGMSQGKMADIIGVDRGTFNRWLNGKFSPNDIWTYRIQKFLKQKGVKV